MNIFDSIILGIVEGATEFLPISSTGHLVLASSLLGVVESDFVKTFLVVIQLGAILAVVALYWRKFFDWHLLKRLVVAFIPTGIIGLALYGIIKTYLLGNDWVVLAALFLGGIALIAFEKYHALRLAAGQGEQSNLSSLSYKTAALIGLAQAAAVIPGISRSGATVLGGLYLGLSRAAIVEFSFLLAVPTMLAASGLSLLKSGFGFSSGEWFMLALGFVAAFLVALASIRWLLGYVRGHSFTNFGWYRIALSVVFALWLVL
jgi:undecaprenyl-diphosphatase